MVWHDLRAGQIFLEHICGFHLWTLRDRGGPAVFFPLGGAPPLPVIGEALRREMERRRPRVYQPTVIYGGTIGFFGGTSTGSFTQVKWG